MSKPSKKTTPAAAVSVKTPEPTLQVIAIKDIVFAADREEDDGQGSEGSIETLTESLVSVAKASGQPYGNQQPVQVVDRSGVGLGKFELFAGRRRCRGSKEGGLTHVLALVYPPSMTALERELAGFRENVTRKNLKPLEKAAKFSLLQDKYGMKAEDIARETGCSIQRVYNGLRIAKKITTEAAIFAQVNNMPVGAVEQASAYDTTDEQVKAMRAFMNKQAAQLKAKKEAAAPPDGAAPAEGTAPADGAAPPVDDVDQKSADALAANTAVNRMAYALGRNVGTVRGYAMAAIDTAKDELSRRAVVKLLESMADSLDSGQVLPAQTAIPAPVATEEHAEPAEAPAN